MQSGRIVCKDFSSYLVEMTLRVFELYPSSNFQIKKFASGRCSFHCTAVNKLIYNKLGVLVNLKSSHITARNTFAVGPVKGNREDEKVKYGVGYQAAYHHYSQRF
jgi:hypothetical protein